VLVTLNTVQKIAIETSNLSRYNKKPTVSSREIQTAVRSLNVAAYLFSLVCRDAKYEVV
jgi:hypothetical protein